jgi:YD repeat-containing protein
MNKKNIYLTFIFYTICTSIFCQNDGLTNYTAHSTFGDYKNNQTYVFDSPVKNVSDVDMFRGRINVDIPIYTIKTNGYEYPISLHYESNGFKVNQMSSWVGLGWELSVPGVIKRTVQGTPDDEGFTGFLGLGGNELFELFLEGGTENDIYDNHFATPSYWDPYEIIPDGSNYGTRVWAHEAGEDNDEAYCDLRRIAGNYFDGMPDIFTFSTGRQSGKFVFDRDSKIHQIPKSHNQIFFSNPTGNWESSNFTIIDENGIKYIYDVVDTEKPVTQWSILPQQDYIGQWIMNRSSGLHFNYTYLPYVSAWHLGKIIFPNGEEVLLNYESDDLRYISSINESYFNSAHTYDGALASTTDPNLYTQVNRMIHEIYTTKNRLTSIEWDGNSIEFNKSTEKREDMTDNPSGSEYGNGYALDNIVVKDTDDQIIKKLQLQHSYFEQEGHGMLSWGEACWKRLKLESITEINRNTEELPPYNFVYNETTDLPSIYSHHRDIWGYYKYLPGSGNLSISKPRYYIYINDGANPVFNCIYSIYPRTSTLDTPYITDGYDMTPDIAGASTYMLKEIHYPTGGINTIDYEMNTFRYDGADVNGQGVRVKEIQKTFSDNQTTTTLYKYSNADTTTGLVASLPTICKFDEGAFNNLTNASINRTMWGTQVFSEVRNQADTEVGYMKVTKETINAQNPSLNFKSVYHFDFSGNCFKYEDVYHDELGEYIYKRSKSHIWLEDQITGYWPLGSEWTYLSNHKIRDRNPDLLNPDFDWFRGSLLKEEHFNNEDELVQSTTWDYQVSYDIDRIYGINAYTYFLFAIPEGTLIGLAFVNGATTPVYSEGVEYRKIRWGAQCYTSAFKLLKSKIVKNFFNGQELIDEYTYGYTGDYETTNKMKVCKITRQLSNGITNSNTFRYSFNYAYHDCFDAYQYALSAIYAQYLQDLETNCYSTDLCIEFDNGYTQICSDCVDASFATFIGRHSSAIVDFGNCCDEEVSSSDDNYATAIMQLAARNQLDVIETQNQITKGTTTYQTSGKLTLYDFFPSDQILPAQSLSTKISSPQIPIETRINQSDEFVYPGYEIKTYFDDYDNHGNLREYHEKDNYPNTLLFGYNYSYLIAKIGNLSYSNILPNLGCTYEQLQEKTSIELIAIFNNLRTTYPEAFIASYTYDPLIGMTSETDPSGKITFYNYDDFNRLETVKDHDGNIIKHVDYHYIEQ